MSFELYGLKGCQSFQAGIRELPSYTMSKGMGIPVRLQLLDRRCRHFMPDTQEAGDTIFEPESKSEEEADTGDLPLFVNDNLGVAAWANEDTNGDFYVSVKINLLDRSVNLFVPDDIKDDFNRFVEHIKEEKGR